MVKNIFATILAIGMLSWAGGVLATPVTFDVNGANDSYVNVTNNISVGTLSATLSADLATLPDFILNDTESKTIDFFTFNATSGFLGAGGGLFEVDANLSFDAPVIDVSGSGDGAWGSVYIPFIGRISGGAFLWDDAVQSFTLSDGNIVDIALSQGFTLVAGSSQLVTATVTNLGGGTTPTPTPEPSTIITVGILMLGLVGYNRRRFSWKS